MRKALARIIAMFAALLTLPLSPVRRREAQVMAAQLIKVGVTRITDMGEVKFEATARASFRKAWAVGHNEPDTLEWIRAMPGKSVFWDIGANIGTFSLYAAQLDDVYVVAFEPSANSYSELSNNINLNRKSSRIASYCIALSGETKLDVLNMSSMDAGKAFNGFGTEVNQFEERIDTRFRHGAVGFAVDDFAKQFSPPLPTHVKIDVDGIEADILRGGRRTFSDPSVRSMIVEIEGNLDSPRNREIFSLMEEMGFTARPKASPEYRNVVFDR